MTEVFEALNHSKCLRGRSDLKGSVRENWMFFELGVVRGEISDVCERSE